MSRFSAQILGCRCTRPVVSLTLAAKCASHAAYRTWRSLITLVLKFVLVVFFSRKPDHNTKTNIKKPFGIIRVIFRRIGDEIVQAVAVLQQYLLALGSD